MKKIIFILITFVFLLVACGSPEENVIKEHNRFEGGGTHKGAWVIVDKDTGCEYLFVKQSNGGGLSVLYDEDGNVSCGNN